MGLADELEALAKLHRDGVLTDDEYKTAKDQILHAHIPTPQLPARPLSRRKPTRWVRVVLAGVLVVIVAVVTVGFVRANRELDNFPVEFCTGAWVPEEMWYQTVPLAPEVIAQCIADMTGP